MTGGPLAGTTVVELATTTMAAYAGRLLGDLGASVTKVETGVGDPARAAGPFIGADDPDESGLFHALHAGKRGCVVPQPDTTALGELLVTTDVVVCDEKWPGTDALADRHPHLVVARAEIIPHRDMGLPALSWTSLHASALSGVSALIGCPDREPLPLPFDVVDYVGGANLAAAAVAARLHQHEGGGGQLVTVSLAEVLSYIMSVSSILGTVGTTRAVRSGRSMPGSGGFYPFRVFRTLDGAVAVACRSDRDWANFLRLIGNPAWADDPRFCDPRVVAREHAADADALLEPWFATQRTHAVFDEALRIGLPLAPLATIAEVLELEQFRGRGAFSEPIHVGGAAVKVVKAPYHFSRTPVPLATRRGPALGEHEVPAAREAPVPSGAPRSRRVLDGLRVIDLSWVWSGPMAASALGELGADVIKIEHRDRLDNSRLRGRPTRNGRPIDADGPDEEISLYFLIVNRGKRSFTLNLKDDRGRELLRELVDVSDVLIENLPPGTFDRLGLGYEALAERNPRLIYLAMSTAGATGPLRDLRAYAHVMSGVAGLEGLVGYPDDPAVGAAGFAVADPNATSHALLAVLAAVAERQRSGLGQYIDVSQIETLAATLCEPFAIRAMTGAEPPTLGARHLRLAPHGHFRVAGDDVWVALAVTSDDEWRRLAIVVGGTSLADDVRFATAADRVRNVDVLDTILDDWFRGRDRDGVVHDLLGAGVAAAPVLTEPESRDIGIRRHTTVHHPYLGAEPLVDLPWRFSTTPTRIAGPSPTIGQHTAEVLRDVLGYDETEVDALLAAPATR